MEHHVPHASLPDPGKIGARLRCHDNQPLPPSSQRAGSVQMIYLHYDDTRDRQIRPLYQMNLMHAVA